MATGADVDFKGDKALQRAFDDLTGPKQKKAVRKGLRAGAKLVAERARQFVHIGKTSKDFHKAGTFRKSIKVKAIKRTRRFIGAVVTTSGAEVADKSGVSYYAVFPEYGTVNQPPQAPLRRAFDSMHGQATELARKETGRAVEKIWRSGK